MFVLIQSLTGQLGVAFTVEWKPMWEPFYISRSDAPLYDERFRQYGYNRISQVILNNNQFFNIQERLPVLENISLSILDNNTTFVFCFHCVVIALTGYFAA